LIPGATDLQHCPEVLWGNAKHWGHAVDQEERTRIFRVERDEAAATRKARTVPIEVPAQPERSSKTHLPARTGAKPSTRRRPTNKR
jgi:hypothetical protein